MSNSGPTTSSIIENLPIEDGPRDAGLTLRAMRQHRLAIHIVRVKTVDFESIVAVVQHLVTYRSLLNQAPTTGLSALAGPHAYAH
jgi:hypothetical protein